MLVRTCIEKMSIYKNVEQRAYIPIPKCLTASLVFLFPLSKIVLLPVGARRASWSRVIASPPEVRILSLAALVNLSAATESLGTSRRRISSVTVPTMTTTLDS